jgi:hypothetical protein
VEGGGGLSSVATVPLAGEPYCAALDPIAFRCGSRKTERQEKHAKEDGHRQGRYCDEKPDHKLASLVTDPPAVVRLQRRPRSRLGTVTLSFGS